MAVLLSYLAEFDRRRLAGAFGQPSLFYYCVKVLGFSEGAAYKRIQAARAVRDFPEIVEELARGRLSFTAVILLSPHLNRDNVGGLLEAARGKTSRELECLIASLAPRPDAPDLLRALPVGGTAPASGEPTPALEFAVGPEVGGGAVAPPAAPVEAPGPEAGRTAPPARFEPRRPEPLSDQRFLFRFTGGRTLREKYDRARALLLGRAAGRGMEGLFEAALDALLEGIDPDRRAKRREARSSTASRVGAVRRAACAPAGRPAGRRVPQAVKDVVWRRDAGRCTFVGPNGERCPESARLEYDHIVPWALGGPSDEPSNLRLACRTHNDLEARRVFGDAAISAAVAEARKARSAKG
ncbi:HNH endonuclease [bacterium]|nr:MAG: HNH endonuclease [bacterium]